MKVCIPHNAFFLCFYRMIPNTWRPWWCSDAPCKVHRHLQWWEVSFFSSSAVLTYLDGLLSPQETERPTVKELKHTIKTDLKNSYNQYKPILNKGTFLDPRFRALTLSQEEKDSTIEEVKLEIVEASHDEQISQTLLTAPPRLMTLTARSLGILPLWPTYLEQSVSRAPPISMGDPQSDRELMKKSIHTCPSLHSMLKVIHWSGGRPIPYPLSSIARKYLSIPATSVPSERGPDC